MMPTNQAIIKKHTQINYIIMQNKQYNAYINFTIQYNLKYIVLRELSKCYFFSFYINQFLGIYSDPSYFFPPKCLVINLQQTSCTGQII